MKLKSKIEGTLLITLLIISTFMFLAMLKVEYTTSAMGGYGLNYIRRDYSQNYTMDEFFGEVAFFCPYYNGTGTTKIIEYSGVNFEGFESEWSIWIYNASDRIGLNMTIRTPEIEITANLGNYSLEWHVVVCYCTKDIYGPYELYVNIDDENVWYYEIGTTDSRWGRCAFGSIQCNDTLEETFYLLYFDCIDTWDFCEDFEDPQSFYANWNIIGDCALQNQVVCDGEYALQVPLSKPSLSVHVSPETITINRNATETFTAEVTGGLPPYTYQWFVNGTPQDVDSPYFNFRTETLGFYQIWCNVTDAEGATVKSNVANCTVSALSLEVTVSPAVVSINLGECQTVTASVVGGTPPIQYQWYKNGTTPIGTNSSKLQINATEWGVGVWTLHCNVTDSLNIENKSNVVNVYISLGVLNVSISPSGTIKSCRGLKTDFTSTVSGGIPPYTYQWLVNNQPKATTSSFTLLHTEAQTYNVILKVTDAGGTVQWSNTVTIVASNPNVTLTSNRKILKVGETAMLTCTATPNLGNYTFLWFKNESLIYQSQPSPNNINRYAYTATTNDIRIATFKVQVTFNTSYVDPFNISSNTFSLTIFGVVQRLPSLVANLTHSGQINPIGTIPQKSAFSANGYFWQFFFDGWIDNGILEGYLRYKCSLDAQYWIEPDGSPYSGSKIFNFVPFWDVVVDGTHIWHGLGGGGWGNYGSGVPFTVYYDRNNETLYLVYTQADFTSSNLTIVTATFNEQTCDWNWGTPTTIASYTYQLPVSPTMTITNNDNLFISYLISIGDTGASIPLYNRGFAYYNGTEWHVFEFSFTATIPAQRLQNFDNKVLITFAPQRETWYPSLIFDTETETFTSYYSGEELRPNEPIVWNNATFIDDVWLYVTGSINGTNWLAGKSQYVFLRVDFYDGYQWHNNVSRYTWVQEPITTFHFLLETGYNEYTFERSCRVTTGWLPNYVLPTDDNLQKMRVRFQLICPPYTTATITIDHAYLVLYNSFGCPLETLEVTNYTNPSNSRAIGHTWEELHANQVPLNVLDGVNETLEQGVNYTLTFPLSEGLPGGSVRNVFFYMYGPEQGLPSMHCWLSYDGGATWHYYGTVTPSYWGGSFYYNLTSYFNSLGRVNNAQIKLCPINNDVVLDYACLIHEYTQLPYRAWTLRGVSPYINATDTSNISITESGRQIYIGDNNYYWLPPKNMISNFTFQKPVHSINATSEHYILSYSIIDFALQYLPNGNITVFIVGSSQRTLIENPQGLTNLAVRHDNVEIWRWHNCWTDYFLWCINVSDIDEVFSFNAPPIRIGHSIRHSAGGSSHWDIQDDGLHSKTLLATSLTLDNTSLSFHYFEESMYVTRYNGYNWDILRFLVENVTIARMNYGEDRCFSYAIQVSSWQLKFCMPFVRIQIKAQTVDGEDLEGVGMIINGELVYTPYNCSYDIVGLYSIELFPEHITFQKEDVTYAFVYYIVEASPQIRIDSPYFERQVTGDMTITVVYAVGVFLTKPTPQPPPTIQYCLPPIFWILMIIVFMSGLYFFSQRKTWLTSVLLIPIILWLIIFEPKIPIEQMPIAILRFFTVPPWHLYLAVALTAIVCILLLTKKW